VAREAGAERAQCTDEFRAGPRVRRDEDVIDRQRLGVHHDPVVLLEELRDECRAAATDVEDDAGRRGARRRLPKVVPLT
jgi:hypothetical protein